MRLLHLLILVLGVSGTSCLVYSCKVLSHIDGIAIGIDWLPIAVFPCRNHLFVVTTNGLLLYSFEIAVSVWDFCVRHAVTKRTLADLMLINIIILVATNNRILTRHFYWNIVSSWVWINERCLEFRLFVIFLLSKIS